MESCELAHSVVGTPLYMSPELCLSRPYDHKSDVWSRGGVLYEPTSLRRPFSAQGFARLIMSVLRGRCAPIPLQARLPPFGAAPRPRVGSCGAAKRHSCARTCAANCATVQYSTDLRQPIDLFGCSKSNPIERPSIDAIVDLPFLAPCPPFPPPFLPRPHTPLNAPPSCRASLEPCRRKQVQELGRAGALLFGRAGM